MKSLLGKIAIRKVVGLYLGEHEVAASEVAVTPLGPIEIASRVEPCAPNELMGTIERVLQSFQNGRRRRLQVGVGLPNSRVFFGTRPLRGGADPSPDAVLQKLLCSSDISTDDLTVDLIKCSIDKAPAASVAACRKKYMAAVLGAMERCGALPIRAEPAACALVRAAAHQHRSPRRAKTLLWIFLGADEGLAVLTTAGLPLAWRPFAMPAFSEGMAILSAARTLLSQNRHHGLESALDYALVHGRPDIHERLQQDGLPTDMGARMLWRDAPELNGPTTAFGLALGCLNQTTPAFDLSRWIKPRALLRDIFPWGELACECTLMVLMGLLLAHGNESVHAAYSAAKVQCGKNKVLASASATQLEKEKKELTKKLEAAHQFLDSRILWTTYLRDMASRLPEKIQISQFQGLATLDAAGKVKKSLQIAATSSLTSNGAVPPEVGKFLAALRDCPPIKRDFSQIDLTGIRQANSGNSKDGAGFTIVGQPGGGTK